MTTSNKHPRFFSQTQYQKQMLSCY